MLIMDDALIFEDFDMGEYTVEKYIERRGWIYIVTDSAFPDHVKIGRTSDMTKRMTNYNEGKPFPSTRVHCMSDKFDNVIQVEKKILEYLYKIIEPTTFRKEWFEIKHLNLLVEVIEEAEKYYNK